jgi:AraC-like DNA-binding protein
MKLRLSTRQTRDAIARLGIERSMRATFGLVDAAVGVRYDMHAHSRHQLIMPSAGVVWVETRDRLYACEASTALWIPARCRHATTVGGRPVVSMFFSARRYRSPVRQPSAVRLTPLLRQMTLAAVTEAADLAAVDQRKLFDLLFVFVERAIRADGVTVPAIARPRSTNLLAALDYLLAHLETVTVPGLARAAGLSERTLRRRYLDELQTTPERYVQRTRLICAMQMLAEPGSGIAEVALRVGYSNQSAFAAAFRRTFGVAPGAVRRAAQPAPPSLAPTSALRATRATPAATPAASIRSRHE